MHLRFLITEIYKNILQLNPYSLRKGATFGLPKTHSFYYGTNSLYFRVSLIWNNLPDVAVSSNSLYEFKNKITNIENIDCGCLL